MAKRPATQPKKAASLPAIAVFHGPEAFLRAQRTHALRAQLTTVHGELSVFTFDGASATPADVLDECRSLGLIAQHKLVIVENAEALVKDSNRALFERYAQNPCQSATLVLRSGNWRPGNLDKLIAAVGTVEKCEPPTPEEAARWAVDRAKEQHRAVLEPDAAAALIARTGTELGRIESELGKLACAALDDTGRQGAITRELVAQFVGVSREEAAWNVQRTLLAGNTPGAIAHIRHVLGVSRQPEVLVLYAVTDLARKLHGVSRGVRAGQNEFALAKTLKLWGEASKVILDVGKRLQPGQTLAFLRSCVRADLRSKSGLSDIPRSLEALAIELQAMLAQARRVGA